ncbi:hypothetical protein EDB86DRAFT_2837683 [Lactarius hatsudake]|nr:hypothetical protein EDB86DRAFT_2837683 [Lactarius hatsudake]
MDPTQQPEPQRGTMAYHLPMPPYPPPTPPHVVSSHTVYPPPMLPHVVSAIAPRPHGIPLHESLNQGYPAAHAQYPQCPLMPPMSPYLPMPPGYGQHFQGWPPMYAPYTPVQLPAPAPTAALPSVDTSAAGNTPTRQNTMALEGTLTRAPKKYLNVQRRPGVWEFDVNVILSIAPGAAKRTFTAHTSMTWKEFEDEVLLRFGDDTLKPIKLVYKISGDTGRLSVLNNVVDWDSAITCVCNKIKTVRKRAVCLEVKNAAKPPPKVPKEKRKREDDIPPPVDTALMPQINAFKQLENTLRCEAHRGHCYVDRSGGRDNHQRLTLGKMTEWAKEVSMGRTSIYHPPHNLQFDRAPAKRGRLSGGTPEVHVAVNIASPLPGAGASYTVNTTHHVDQRPLSSQGTRSKQLTKPDNGTSPQACATTSAPEHVKPNPPVRLLLQLMDIDEPLPDLQYVSLEPELAEMQLHGICEVYDMPVELLATFGWLDIDRATRLHTYIEENLLPLIQPRQDRGAASGDSEKVSKLEVEGKGKGKMLVKEESRDVLVEWPEEEWDPLGKDEIEDEDELPPIEVLGDDSDAETDISGCDT